MVLIGEIVCFLMQLSVYYLLIPMLLSISPHCSQRKNTRPCLFEIREEKLQKRRIPCHIHSQERRLLVSMLALPHCLILLRLPITSKSVVQFPSHSRDGLFFSPENAKYYSSKTISYPFQLDCFIVCPAH